MLNVGSVEFHRVYALSHSLRCFCSWNSHAISEANSEKCQRLQLCLAKLQNSHLTDKPSVSGTQATIKLSGKKVALPRRAADVSDNLLGRFFSCSGFLSHLHSVAATMGQKSSVKQSHQIGPRAPTSDHQHHKSIRGKTPGGSAAPGDSQSCGFMILCGRGRITTRY